MEQRAASRSTHINTQKKRVSAAAAIAVVASSLAGVITLAFAPPQISTAQGACVPVSTAGLSGHWKFDENAGTTAADASGMGHAGTLENGIAWTSGVPAIAQNSGALLFDGIDDQVRVAMSATGSSALGMGTGSFTVGAFVKTGSGNRSVLGNFSVNRGWGLYLYGDGRVNFFGYGTAGANDTSHPSAILDGSWHHVAGVYTRSGSQLTIDTYVDGTWRGSNTSTVGDITSGSDLLFGRYLGQAAYAGALDDVRIYGRALSAAEIDALSEGCNGSSSSVSSSSVSSTGSSVSSFSSSSIAAAPQCEGMTATIFIRNGRIVGGPMDGQTYFGILRGTEGNDVIFATNGSDIVGGKSGDDHICGRNGADILYGDDGDDGLHGANGRDILLGNAGDDLLEGGNGMDLLNGGPGEDDCMSGRGNDLVVNCET